MNIIYCIFGQKLSVEIDSTNAKGQIQDILSFMHISSNNCNWQLLTCALFTGIESQYVQSKILFSCSIQAELLGSAAEGPSN